MINWIEGHNNDPRAHFKVLVRHDGVYNSPACMAAPRSFGFRSGTQGYALTNKAMYERWSPHNFVANFKTPILIIHGELDYRVLIGRACNCTQPSSAAA